MRINCVLNERCARSIEEYVLSIYMFSAARLWSHVMLFGSVCRSNQKPTTNSRIFCDRKNRRKKQLVETDYYCSLSVSSIDVATRFQPTHTIPYIKYIKVQTLSVKHMSFCLHLISIGQFFQSKIKPHSLMCVWHLRSAVCVIWHRFMQPHASIDIRGQSFWFAAIENSPIRLVVNFARNTATIYHLIRSRQMNKYAGQWEMGMPCN